MEIEIESREDLKSILPFLPLLLRSSTLFWPSQVVETLKSMAAGPDHSGVNSGEALFHSISNIRNSLSLPNQRLASSSQHGYVLFFDKELIGALLACAFFCLFPVIDRRVQNLPTINFDYLFAILYDGRSKMQENKIRCLVHYFRRICSSIPVGFVSFERKVLPLNNCAGYFCCPKANFWINSTIPLCQFREEIRFMINPELITGMLFLPAMADNEAIEIVGAERFSNYTGYAFNFCFAGNHEDKREIDSLGRHKTFITAIDALCSPGMRQYRLEFLLREVNKAFCGFFDQSKYDHYKSQFLESGEDVTDHTDTSRNNLPVHESISDARENYFGRSLTPECLDHKDDIGIATGNWGCGAFGGDPQVKSIIQWLAASQALRPFVMYYTIGTRPLHHLEKVSEWILAHKWTVGDLWSMLVEYCSQISNGQTHVGFFDWLLPASSKTNLCCLS
ncbi:probable poly(ADP-ribose) glycohydrolase 2 isoform X6 [Cucumis melo]|uniref:poly(ADP-ribose) glycohydrolase n=1 Tax=Cucumis melo TaxID=3656 RepID=A0ABM3KRQ4_CUCME|nr:probable poly(ADP-ribose) glycohydrolase 2 isoform X6 [Cucumis melo]